MFILVKLIRRSIPRLCAQYSDSIKYFSRYDKLDNSAFQVSFQRHKFYVHANAAAYVPMDAFGMQKILVAFVESTESPTGQN